VSAPAKARPDASMTLLVEVMERPLDPGYAEAAARRRAAHDAGRTARRSKPGAVLVALVGVVLGIVTVTAAQALRAPQESIAAARALLEEEISERSGEAAGLEVRAAELSAEIEELQRATLEARDPAVLGQLRLDAVATGTTPVTGPGLVVTLTDGGTGGLSAAAADPDARVRDVDVQTVVNALWASGAEAISVEDQRLTALSAIRNAGDAVLVDLVPLPGPTYVIRAVGDPQSMQSEYARSGAPSYFQLLAAKFGIESSAVTEEDLSLPGAGVQSLRYARALTDGGDAAGAAGLILEPGRTPRGIPSSIGTLEESS
jgi:uncharacterized protein YlxW (UPF0749 family)